MKGLSQIASLVIITAVVVAVSLAVFYGAMMISDWAVLVMEYGQVKSILKDIATIRFEDILRGASVKYYLTLSRVGIGYRKLDYSMHVIVETSTSREEYIVDLYSIYARSFKPLASSKTVLYGTLDKYLVNTTAELPLVLEYNDDVGTVVEAVLSKVKYAVYNVTYGDKHVILVKVLIPRFVKPVVIGKNVISVRGSVNETLSRSYQSVSEFKIYVNSVEVANSSKILSSVGLNPSEVSSFDLEIVVYDVLFEVY